MGVSAMKCARAFLMTSDLGKGCLKRNVLGGDHFDRFSQDGFDVLCLGFHFDDSRIASAADENIRLASGIGGIPEIHSIVSARVLCNRNRFEYFAEPFSIIELFMPPCGNIADSLKVAESDLVEQRIDEIELLCFSWCGHVLVGIVTGKHVAKEC